jgi:hypothetical protein
LGGISSSGRKFIKCLGLLGAGRKVIFSRCPANAHLDCKARRQGSWTRCTALTYSCLPQLILTKRRARSSLLSPQETLSFTSARCASALNSFARLTCWFDC